jgi:hypothetical protein
MGVVNVAARHNLQAVTDMGNVTTHTVEFTNPTTSLVASGNVVVTGNVVAGYLYGDGSNITGISSTSNLQVVSDTGNVTSNTIQFTNATTGFVTTSRVGIKTTTPVATLHINGSLYNTAKIELLKRLVTIRSNSLGNAQLHPLQSDMQLYESDSRNAWMKYQFASDSDWLIGTLGSDTVNGGTSSSSSTTSNDMSISVNANVTAFMIRNVSGWSAVSMSGWTSLGTVATVMDGYTTNFEIWARTFAQGIHSMNTYSAMYAFTI